MPKPSRGSRRCPSLQPESALGKSPQRALAFPIAAALALLWPWAQAVGGDILRGGRPAAPVGGSRSSSGTVADPVAGAAAANARDALARTSKAVDAVQAMQNAARAQGRSAPQLNYLGHALPPVPNGLTTGGLQVATGADSRWQGASLPRMTVESGQSVVTIKQTDSRALLNWETFNVGKNTSLVFDQSAGGNRIGQWIAYNKIIDPSLNPSQILGSIRAGGQVYVINPNGIIFGGSSTVNVHTLTASTLSINENLIARGLLNQETRNPQFLFNSLLTDGSFTIPASSTYTTAQPVADGSVPKLTFTTTGGTNDLAATVDYALSKDATGRDVVTFTPAGLGKVGTSPVSISYASRAGDVVVQAGARLKSPSTAAKVGGRIALFAPNVVNAGTIATPDGQTILAAGRQVGLTAHPSNDPTLRGLDVFVGAADSGSGRVTNSGIIEATRASVSMAGKTVEQLGVIDSSTSVSLNGRIDLRANYGAIANAAYDPVLAPDIAPFLLASTGTVTLGSGSVMRIMPEIASAETTIGTTLALRSQVNLQGKVIHLAQDAFVLAPNAVVNADAGRWNLVPSTTTPVNTFVHSGGQIYLESGATINVAGTADVPVPISQNILTLQLRGAELADSPLQRTGPLRGASLTVDLRIGGTFNGLSWVGTPLGDVSGFAGLIQRTAAELTVAGGSVNLRAGDSVVMQPGSLLDVSGGYINFQGGLVHTTRIFSGGQLLDISKATPDQAFNGIYTGMFVRTAPKYGITETFANPLALNGDHFEQSYLQGADGGTITISAASMALDGKLLGQTIAGARQRDNPAAQSAINFSFTAEIVDPEASSLNQPVSPTPPKVVFGDGLALAPAEPFSLDADGNPAPLRADRLAQAAISPSLFTTGGFGKVSVDNGDGDILVPAGAEIVTPAGGGLTFSAANVEIQRSIRSPGGALSFTVYNFSPYPRVNTELLTLPPPNSGRGRLILGPVTLSTAGLILDDRNGYVANSPLVTAGGSIFIQAFSADLQTGSVLDVSGGVAVNAKGATSYGAGGSIVIAAGRDPQSKFVIGGVLSLNAELRGYSGGKGGSLTVAAPRIVIGESAAQANELALTPAFFSTGGFTSFNLTGFGTLGATLPGLEVLPGTAIHPVATSWLAVPNADGEKAVTLAKMVLPVGLRTPVSLTLNAPGVTDPSNGLAIRGDLVIGAGASIVTDPRAQVSVTGQTVALLGEIIAPGGGINVAGASTFPVRRDQASTVTNASATVYLGPQSHLSTAGVMLLTPDAFGRRNGSILPGGTIRVAGNLVAETGAVLDVSGASGTLDVAPSALVGAASLAVVPANSGLTAPLWRLATVPAALASDAGAISLEGGQELFFNGTLLGKAGGKAALGGTLAVSSGRFDSIDTPPTQLTNADLNLVVTQSGGPLPMAGVNPIGHAVKGANGQAFAAMGYFAIDRFSQGSFDSLSLGGNVRFSGPVTIDAAREISVGSGGVIFANAGVHLSAPHVTLGRPFLPPLAPGQPNFFFQDGAKQPLTFGPTFGNGRLTVTAQLIDVGDLSLQNIGRTALIADNGDIRGDGTLDAAGDLILRAGQIYPVTAATFTLAAYDKTVSIASSTSGSTSVSLLSAALPPGFGVGSHLLGSTVQSINGATVTLAAGADRSISAQTAEVFAPGSITVLAAGARELPLSAGGTLNLYSSRIQQDGVLRAPLGTINIGWDGTGTAPKDVLARLTLPVAQQVTLGTGSITSVSAVDPLTGKGLIIPFGYSTNGNDFINPAGVDISAGLAPGKAVTIAGQSVALLSGATIDQRGGGDLYAYRFNAGNGGSTDLLGWNAAGAWKAGNTYKQTQIVSYGGAFYYARTDITGDALLAPPTPGASWRQVTQSFAILPDYQANFAPFAVFNSKVDPGYVGTLSVGDRIYLQGSPSLSAGTYTLLPSRYALLPGAVLVTPQSGTPLVSFTSPDGSNSVSGYRFNDLNHSRELNPLFTRFEITASDVFRQRAEYTDFFANSFLEQRAQALGLTTPRLPKDAGHTILQATQAMVLRGDILSQGGPDGRGGLVDIASASDILIGGPGTKLAPGVLTLDASQLSRFSAESLLIGGIRTLGPDHDTVDVRTSNLIVDNSGAPLTAPEIILVARKNLTLEAGARLLQQGELGGPASLLSLGQASVPGSGDGVLIRVSSDANAQITRAGRTSSTDPQLIVKAGAELAGTSLILDSTARMVLDPKAVLRGQDISLNSGQISIQLDPALDPATEVPPPGGLVLGGRLLAGLQAAPNLSLLSYSTIDLYGAGNFHAAGQLSLHAGAIRGFETSGGQVNISAARINLDNRALSTAPDPTLAPDGTLSFNAKVISIGANNIAVDHYAAVELNASSRISMTGAGGLFAQGDLLATTPTLTASARASQTLSAGGKLTVQAPAGAKPGVFTSGLGASIMLEGASVAVTSNISLPSGLLTLHARTGDITVGGQLSANGTEQAFYDVLRYTDAGQIRLQADAGSVTIDKDAVLSVAAAHGGGDAGTLAISTPGGTFTLAGHIVGSSPSGNGGQFSLDAGTLPDINPLLTTLRDGGFSQSQKFRVRTGDVALVHDPLVLANDDIVARSFTLSVDQGSITIGRKIDVSGATGGQILLSAAGSVTLLAGTELDASAVNFDHAGKGGSISLETRGLNGGVIDLQAGSTIDLSVDAISKATDPAAAALAAAGLGRFGGTLHLRAPQTAGGTDLAVNPLLGTITGASSITAEGFQVYQVSGADGTITAALQNAISANGMVYGSNSDAIATRLLAGHAALEPVFSALVGAEIVNSNGNITLGTANGPQSDDWNLGDQVNFRFGTKKAPGVLTLRASGDLVFYNALSDGFVSSAYNSVLLQPNAGLPANAQSWSYRLTAGADLTATDVRAVRPLAELTAAGTGSILIGRDAGLNQDPTNPSLPGAVLTANAVRNHFQVIRTGSGDIEVSAGRNIQFLNQFSNIYTVGTRLSVTDTTLGGTFDVPKPSQPSGNTVLGNPQQAPPYIAQYTLAGGNITIAAQGDIERLTLSGGQLVADSGKELPMNWLDRRGAVDPVTGLFTASRFGDIASTSWWVDFSNYFQGVGALGGGNVNLTAGGSIHNIDAVVPTNARMAGKSAGGTPIAPRADGLIELGGGDLLVRAGGDLDAGIYYVERGHGTLDAGRNITTNDTRSPSLGRFDPQATPLGAETWLPTTLFVGKADFDVSARGDLLLGPVANPFLLPQGYNNSFFYKTYFSTYSPSDSINVSSLGGDVTIRSKVALSEANNVNIGTAVPILEAWMDNVSLLRQPISSGPGQTVSFFQPWLRLSETSVHSFDTFFSLTPATLRAEAFSGNINLVGGFNMAPSPTGTLDLLAAGAINGLQIAGTTSFNGVPASVWESSRINISDADPSALLSPATPFAFQTTLPTPNTVLARTTPEGFLAAYDPAFQETGALDSSIQTKQALHGITLLHANDLEPVRLYAGTGDIGDLTLFAPKATRLIAGRDITDIGLYLQNDRVDDVSLASAGRDIVAYNASSPLRARATSDGNFLAGTTPTALPDGQSGDIQISGPGALEVLAGRNLDLGSGANRPDGTGVGLTSVGNARNLSLPFEGASIVAAAGLGAGGSLSDRKDLHFDDFIAQYINPAGVQSARYLPELELLLHPELASASQTSASDATAGATGTSSSSGTTSSTSAASGAGAAAWTEFQALPKERQAVLALEIFYRVLRNAGRDHVAAGAIAATTGGTSATAATAGTTGTAAASPLGYAEGTAAIALLFGDVQNPGEIITQSRDIRTKSGGDINLLAPGGGLTLAKITVGNPQIPPGVVTEDGGNISVFTNTNVDLGISRIFTLRGGNIVIWSSAGNIAAGTSAKTVRSAPPTRVLIDAQSADVQTDLAGLATGGGIGVLATVAGVAPGDVDLIAPLGTVDAGDAGIRATGRLNIAAVTVLNADNISAGGGAAGVPAAAAAPAVTITVAPTNPNPGGALADKEKEEEKKRAQEKAEEQASIITVEVTFGD